MISSQDILNNINRLIRNHQEALKSQMRISSDLKCSYFSLRNGWKKV